MKKADKMSEYAGTNRDIKGLTNRNPGGIMSGKKCGSCLAHAEIPEPSPPSFPSPSPSSLLLLLLLLILLFFWII